ncbi:MAG: hypothetical protein JO001_10225 [Alphaproteobacteria bacterium]|nr:hypothetical protein [Alphaproteobacteria bacterium]
MSKPSHIAYIVSELTDEQKKAGKKPFWRPVGAVWPHSKGDGFTVEIGEQLAVSGRITCRAAKDDETEAGTAE